MVKRKVVKDEPVYSWDDKKKEDLERIERERLARVEEDEEVSVGLSEKELAFKRKLDVAFAKDKGFVKEEGKKEEWGLTESGDAWMVTKEMEQNVVETSKKVSAYGNQLKDFKRLVEDFQEDLASARYEMWKMEMTEFGQLLLDLQTISSNVGNTSKSIVETQELIDEITSKASNIAYEEGRDVLIERMMVALNSVSARLGYVTNSFRSVKDISARIQDKVRKLGEKVEKYERELGVDVEEVGESDGDDELEEEDE